ncbi:C39 family peptidase [Candidatus Woesearchaeota archaeon]|nr:C39 family peptidase [Candidatus Woesearchaeota archaeon]
MRQKKVLDVPKIKQLKMHCGPASLAMVFQYHGLNITQEEVAKYWKNRNIVETGIPYLTLIDCARYFGFTASMVEEHFTLEKIIKNIDREHPIIARVQGGNSQSRHLLVICGYETNPNILWINDPYTISLERELYENFSPNWRIRGIDQTINYGVVVRKKQ